MSASEIRTVTRERIRHALFGENWRADRPTENIGGKIGACINGVPDFATYRQVTGEIAGLIEAMGHMDDSMRELFGQENI